MIKVIKGDLCYYIRDGVTIDLNKPSSLLYMSDVAVDTKTNSIVKCRYPVEALTDAIMKIENDNGN